jgi:hypothetical protein
MKNIIQLLSLLLILGSCVSDTSSEVEIDRFLFDMNIESSKKYLFVESQFSDNLMTNHFKEITWILCNDNDLDAYFDNIAVPIKINQEQINYGSYLFTLENEYVHIRLIDGKTGWIRDSIPISADRKRFLNCFLEHLIDDDYNEIKKEHKSSFYKNQKILSVNGYLTITHFSNNQFALVRYSPILKVTTYDYNLKKANDVGYLVNFKDLKINENYLSNAGMNLDSNYIFEIHRDPYYFKALDHFGNTIKAEGIAK